MKIMVIAVGNLREKFFREACNEYTKRMKLMRPVEIIEIPEETIRDEKSEPLIEQALAKEGEKILSKIKVEDLVVALSPQGRAMASPAFAQAIDIDYNLAANPGKKRLVFIIGSSFGLSARVYEKADWQLSFGPMTFPHQLARVLLLEQIYRGQMINLGRPYHK